MFPEIRYAGKCFRAIGTLVRLGTGVNVLVLLEQEPLGEPLAALVAGVFLGLVVDLHVLHEAVAVGVYSPADLTHVEYG